MIIQKLYKYSFDKLIFSKLSNGFENAETFVLKLRLSSRPLLRERHEIFSMENRVSVSTRILNKQADLCNLSNYEKSEQYFLKCDENGDVAVLEAKIVLEQPFGREMREMQLGIPITDELLEFDVYIVFDRVHFRIIANGEVLNENFPVGELNSKENAEIFTDKSMLESIEYSSMTDLIERTEYERKLDTGINYYSPYGHNTWAGDNVTFYHDGVYHILYFNDRHHHGNRWGGGAHCFSQLTTTDFVNWIDHGPLFELEEQWQSVGTGTMFFHNGKYYFVFGFHTDRVIPVELTYRDEIIKSYNETGEMRLFSYDEIFAAGKYPCGANYAVSDNGIKFKLMNVVCHCGENPSVYSEQDGSLVMFTGYGGSGTWRAKDINSPWKLVTREFPPSGDTPMKNSSECPSYFEWNGYKYLFIGGTGYWRTEKNSDEYIDNAANGYDVYDGLVYPMAVKTKDNRVMCTGWINGIGWGSVIVQRELLQYPDGRLGIKWIPEITSEKGELLYSGAASDYSLKEDSSYYYEFDIVPDKQSYFALRFGDDCELKLNFASETAQYGEVGSEDIPSARACIAAESGQRAPNTHYFTHNYSIERVDVMREPFKLRIIQHNSKKMGCVLIDAEIAGQRTMITCRKNAKINRIVPISEGLTKVRCMSVYKYFDEII